MLPVIGPALLVGASEATYAITLLRTPLEDPDRTGFAAIFIARSPRTPCSRSAWPGPSSVCRGPGRA